MSKQIGLAMLLCAGSVLAQLTPSAAWATHAANEFQVIPNVTYLTASNVELKLDVYHRRSVTTPQPTVIYMHGGFWVAGDKEGARPTNLMPWLEMGYNVVNVEISAWSCRACPSRIWKTVSVPFALSFPIGAKDV